MNELEAELEWRRKGALGGSGNYERTKTVKPETSGSWEVVYGPALSRLKTDKEVLTVRIDLRKFERDLRKFEPMNPSRPMSMVRRFAS